MKSADLIPGDNPTTTLVVFGGIAGGFDLPPFEFRRITDKLAVNKVFLRDTEQGWYQTQINVGPFANLVPEQAETVQSWLATTRTVFAGNSMGGFAAILFGSLLSADRILAFAPQTFVSPWLRLRHRDNRWMRQILRMYVRHGWLCDSYDLRTVLLKKPTTGRVDIFFGEKSRHDKIHAARLSDLPGVSSTSVEGARHGAVKQLRERGELERILHNACALENTDKCETIP